MQWTLYDEKNILHFWLQYYYGAWNLKREKLNLYSTPTQSVLAFKLIKKSKDPFNATLYYLFAGETSHKA